MNKQINTSIRYEEREYQEKGKLIISKGLQNQIMCLHNKCGDTEWSGILLYKILKGSTDDPENLVVKAMSFYLLDIGTPGYTEFNLDENVSDLYDLIPGAENMKLGILHTHHSMNTFFSGTDSQELHDNAKNHVCYLSLIVNHKSNFCAKMAVYQKIQVYEKFFKRKRWFKTEPEELEILNIINFEIEFEQDDWFSTRVSDFLEKRVNSWNQQNFHNGAQQGRTYHLGDYADFKNRNFQKYEDLKSKAFRGQQDLFNSESTKSSYIERNYQSIRSFLSKWISQDLNCTKDLNLVLRETKPVGDDQEFFCVCLEDTFEDYYEKFFKSISSENGLSHVAYLSTKILRDFKYPVIEKILEILDMFLDDHDTQKLETEALTSEKVAHGLI